MRAYVCGPMTGYRHYNHAEFMEAKWSWEEAGWEIDIPFDCNSLVWMRHYKRPFDPRFDTCDYGDSLLKEMFSEDVATLLKADAVIALPGWEKSRGATLEVRIADAFSIPVLKAEYPNRSLERCVRAETEFLRQSREQHAQDCQSDQRLLCREGDRLPCGCR